MTAAVVLAGLAAWATAATGAAVLIGHGIHLANQGGPR